MARLSGRRLHRHPARLARTERRCAQMPEALPSFDAERAAGCPAPARKHRDPLVLPVENENSSRFQTSIKRYLQAGEPDLRAGRTAPAGLPLNSFPGVQTTRVDDKKSK